jgi:protein-tyrosine sulfotransferase
MTISTGFSPRSPERALATFDALARGPTIVPVPADDGWTAAVVRLLGRTPVRDGDGDWAAIDRRLGALGLPPTCENGEDDPGLPEVHGPMVSVLICTYNRAHLLGAAIRSALAQRWHREVIVVDDGSTDDTQATITAFPEVRAFRQKNTGKSGALAKAIAEARGEALLVLDDDDLLVPGALHALASALFSRPSLDAVWSDTAYQEVGADGYSRYFPCARVPPARALDATLLYPPTTTGATLMRTRAVHAVGGHEPRLSRAEDMDIWLRLAANGDVDGIPLPTFVARTHAGARGRADDRFVVTSLEANKRKILPEVRPVFNERWTTLKTGDRRTGHAWAVGLWQRELVAEAKTEAARWPAPYTPSEAWARKLWGETPKLATLSPLLVLDDGDDGALEAALEHHAEGRSLHLVIDPDRGGLDRLRLHWDGQFYRDPPRTLGGQTRIVSTARPDFVSPDCDPRWLPPIPASDAFIAVAAALGWTIPAATRAADHASPHPIAALAVAATHPNGASAAANLLLHTTWPGALRLAAAFVPEALATRCREVGPQEDATALAWLRAEALTALGAPSAALEVVEPTLAQPQGDGWQVAAAACVALGRQDDAKLFGDLGAQKPIQAAWRRHPGPRGRHPLAVEAESLPLVFIGGAGRSGTTLFRAMLDAHPRFYCGPEMKLIPAICNIRAQIATQTGSALAQKGLDQAAMDDLVRTFVASLLKRMGGDGVRLAEKTPHNVLWFEELGRLFPNAKFVHLVRDGRAVAASLVKQRWINPETQQPLWYCRDTVSGMTYWRDIVTEGRRQGEKLGSERYREVRYEDLVSRPEEKMRRVLDFLAEPWDEAVLHHESSDLKVSKLESSTHQIAEAVHTKAIHRWSKEMDARQRREVERVGDALLREYGYLG